MTNDNVVNVTKHLSHRERSIKL